MSPEHLFIQSHTHNGRIGVLVEFGLEFSITAKCNAFSRLSKDLAMHIAASNPENLVALLEQPFVKNTFITVAQWLSEASAELKDNIIITRFVRWVHEPVKAGPPPDDQPAVAVRMKLVR